MTITELGAIGELVGGVAVLATLIYLAMQIRQNTKTLGATAYAQTQNQFLSWSAPLAADDGKHQLFLKGLEEPQSLSGLEERTFYMLANEFFFAMEDLFHLWEQRLIDDETWDNQFENSLIVLDTPGASAVLKKRRGPLSAKLTDYVAAHSGR